MKKQPTWRELLREYSNPARVRVSHDPDFGGRASDGMMGIAQGLLHSAAQPGPTREEVVGTLRDFANKSGVLDQIHMVSHGTSGDVAHHIPEGATNRQIIDMIEQADESTE